MSVVSRGIRNAFRNIIRTASIAIILGLSIGLCLIMLIAREAVSSKIASVEASIGNTISISPAGFRSFTGGGNPLKMEKLEKVKKLAHVKSVTESLTGQLNSDNSNLKSAVDAGSLGPKGGAGAKQGMGAPSDSTEVPIPVTGSTDPTNLASTLGGGTFTLKSGQAFAGNSAENIAMLGASLASKNNLTVGSTFKAYGANVKVAVIFDAGNTFANNQVIMPLATLQKLSSQTGAVTNATVTVDSVLNIDETFKAVKESLGSDADVTNSQDEAKKSIAPLKSIQAVSLYSLIGSVGAGAIIILFTMIMIVRERKREIGITKALGFSNLRIMMQFMSEAVTLTLLGSVIGIGLGFVGGSPITKLLVNNSSSGKEGQNGAVMMPGGADIGNTVSGINATVGWDIIFYGLGAAILIAVIGSALASWFIAKVRPAEVLRSE
jgi:putative ABC transport system permease protein